MQQSNYHPTYNLSNLRLFEHTLTVLGSRGLLAHICCLTDGGLSIQNYAHFHVWHPMKILAHVTSKYGGTM